MLAMIAAGFADQQILAFFSQPGRDFNHNKVAGLRSMLAKHDPRLPAAVTEPELQHFLDRWAIRGTLPEPFFAWAAAGVESSLWRVEYHFHPVGQGLLHSGALRQGRRRPFAWVYDCGSRTSQTALETELDGIPPALAAAGGSASLDLVTLSHFDQDHVSGLVHLLGIVDIKLLLLPFLSLWQRMWIAASADDLSADFQRFLIDPAGYLIDAATAAGRPPPRIVFVGESDPDAPPAPPITGEPSPEPDGEPPEGRAKRHDRDRPGDGQRRDDGQDFNDRPMQLRLETDPAPDIIAGEVAGVTGRRLNLAEFLRVESVLDIDGLWEFVPYNDARQARKCPPGFPAKIQPLVQALLDAKTVAARDKAFGAIKAEYAKTFGSSSYSKNIISLFLYGGPVTTPINAEFWTHRVHPGGIVDDWRSDDTRLDHEHLALLLTGDGSLNTKPKREAFASFYRPYRRIERSAVFQVMHHGASGNSSDEVAPLVEPRASIFSSDPMHFNKHPDADVLRQFWPYNCVQVDASKGWGLRGIFEF